MSGGETKKPSCDDWLRWTQVVVDRLTAVVHTYNSQSPDMGFIPQKERQFKSAQTLELLRKLYSLADSIANIAPGPAASEEEERLIKSVMFLIPEVLRRLPAISSDMQIILKSPWYSDFPTRAAGDLFFGPEGREAEGIGSGHIEHGRLPEKLNSLLEAEEIGTARSSRGDMAGSGDRRREVARRWSDRNSSFMRSAGSVN